MKKCLKITLIVLIVLALVIVLDTLQAKVFNNSPLLKIRENYDGSIDYIDKGIFVNHYYCTNNDEKTLFKKTKYTCPLEDNTQIDNYQEHFSEKEQKIIDAINKNIVNSAYFDMSNLKSFAILELQLYGYYKSKSHIFYIRVNYNVECNDNTYSCDNISKNKDYSLKNNEPFYFFIKIDTNNYNNLEVIEGISADINSDWISDYSAIE